VSWVSDCNFAQCNILRDRRCTKLVDKRSQPYILSVCCGSDFTIRRLASRCGQFCVLPDDVLRTTINGRVETKPLLHTQAAGLPDYSELFVFGWSGEYKIRIIVKRPGVAPIETQFVVHHAV